MTPSNKRSDIFDWLKVTGLVIILLLCIKWFLFSTYEVEGNSMEPTLNDGNQLIVNQMTYEITDVARFDIIIFHDDNGEDYVKRVIGLPGEQIEYRDDRLYVDGQYIEEPYLEDNRRSLFLEQKLTGDFTIEQITGEKKVPENMLFVMGDNRLNSLDSRHFGFVSIDDIVGKVNVLYWPIEKFYIDL